MREVMSRESDAVRDVISVRRLAEAENNMDAFRTLLMDLR